MSERKERWEGRGRQEGRRKRGGVGRRDEVEGRREGKDRRKKCKERRRDEVEGRREGKDRRKKVCKEEEKETGGKETLGREIQRFAWSAQKATRIRACAEFSIQNPHLKCVHARRKFVQTSLQTS